MRTNPHLFAPMRTFFAHIPIYLHPFAAIRTYTTYQNLSAFMYTYPHLSAPIRTYVHLRKLALTYPHLFAPTAPIRTCLLFLTTRL